MIETITWAKATEAQRNRVLIEHFIVIIIKDNGVGIDKDDINKIFDPFFTKKAKGTGLGLTICKELVNLHGGTLSIKSEKNKGTIVTIKIPIKRKHT